MKKIFFIFRKALSMPPHVLLKKIVNRLRFKHKFKKKIDLLFDTSQRPFNNIIINSYIEISQCDIKKYDLKIIEYLIQMYTMHRFDLLGSGWVCYSYHNKALGVEGIVYDAHLNIDTFDQKGNWISNVVRRAHLKSAKKIWYHLRSIDSNYEPIDWQKDHKSGYRWSAKRWFMDQGIGHKPGTDIKVPWEISRMQHLPFLAIYTQLQPGNKERLINEFQCQVLDFIAMNPPRMGANWRCPMDVAIRAVNILVAYDLFKQVDTNKIITAKFNDAVCNSMYDHGLHIVNNLEYTEYLTSNHYLSDIVGLLYIAAYLPGGPQIDTWLAFSVQELVVQFKKQFHDDGTNFEASTSYHRLSGELIIYGTALLLGLKQDKLQTLINYNTNNWKRKPLLLEYNNQEYSVKCLSKKQLEIELPSWYIDRLYKMGLFSTHITKQSGEICQIGDNDSGRLFKFTPLGIFKTNGEAEKEYKNLEGYCDNLINNDIFSDNVKTRQELYWDENCIDHSSFISGVSGFFENAFPEFVMRSPFEKSFIRSMSKNKILQKPVKQKVNIKEEEYTLPEQLLSKKYSFPGAVPLTKDLKLLSYPDFGLYIYRNERLFLSIFAGDVGQNGNGGHGHNDKLSYELQVDGIDLERDPGSYLYTPITKIRNEFRSSKSHNGIKFESMDNNILDYLLFTMQANCEIEVITFNESLFTARLKNKKNVLYREIKIQDYNIIVTDFGDQMMNKKEEKINKHLSNGYGKLFKS